MWNLDGTVARTWPELRSISAMNAAGAIVGTATSDGSLVFLPADGGPAQQIVAGGNNRLNAVELTEDNVIHGESATHTPYSRTTMNWSCSQPPNASEN
ncbi:hypothetical protein [Amycolatopsis sp. H20-H5]|uniref:hypothetical protein n=1 Tax=Amycolatopsis sp. H20-H5 TaxID=3046309 RepID=UPI002DBF44B2|nr:hypothetical protein [Amycolatopsis sp. H20-H5]MEC3976441.1 hypothetical protein [Amycolatopsis sp. H20-H5]